jgi:hypothetical protein
MAPPGLRLALPTTASAPALPWPASCLPGGGTASKAAASAASSSPSSTWPQTKSEMAAMEG